LQFLWGLRPNQFAVAAVSQTLHFETGRPALAGWLAVWLAAWLAWPAVLGCGAGQIATRQAIQ